MTTKTNTPLISVIVASYNYENYIKETLESLKNQTYKNFEVIIVDDGSSDNSISLIKEYSEKYDNFHFFTHENCKNKGLIETIKLGLKKSTGQYIAFLESDDYWALNHLEKKADFIKKNKDAVIIVNGIKTIGDSYCDDYVNSQSKILKRCENTNRFKHFGYFEKGNLIPTFSCVTVRKNVLEKCDFDSYTPAWLDYWLWRQIALENKISYIDLELTYWRRHQQSYILKSQEKDKDKGTEAIRKKFLKANNKILIKQNSRLFIHKNTINFCANIFKSGHKLNKIGFYF